METHLLELKPEDIPFATTGLEAPTIYCEYIRGAIVTPSFTKVFLVENRVDMIEDQVKTIHVAQLVVPTEQLRAWGTFFTLQADALGQPPITTGPLAEAVAVAKTEGETDGDPA